MKCLSLRQPYAELVVSGRKTIETRKWKTNFRGKFLVHASKTIDRESSDILNINSSKLTRGAVIGLAFVYDVKRYTTKQDFLADKDKHFSSCYSETKYGFLLRDAKKLNEPIPLAGKLGFFEVKESIIKEQKQISSQFLILACRCANSSLYLVHLKKLLLLFRPLLMNARCMVKK